jgi:UDP-N-acetylmuramoyl-L-alanyl-D-glutamate--2,6-diaminopimelate ligase
VNRIGNMGLRTLLCDLDALTVGSEVAVSGIAYRSDRVAPGDAFFCIRGFRHDGHDFAQDALGRGAVALVVEAPVDLDVPQVVVPDTRAALALASAAFFGHPSSGLDLVGITGTNGKTTSTYLLDSIFQAAGKTTGVIGTVGTSIAGRRLDSTHTTPESFDLQKLLAEMRATDVEAVSMEVSSHAIDLHRVDACDFAAVAFTNLTQDHLDYHHTLEEYFSVKRRLFTEFKARARVVNVDDTLGREMAEEIGAEWTVGRSNDALVRSRNEELDADGSTFVLDTPVGRELVRLPLAGGYNVSNALVAAGSALAAGIELTAIAEGLRTAPQVPGRLERVDCGQPFSVVVDYAHTPDSLEKAINAVRGVTQGRVIVVFGCGGDRDPDKRPLMGSVAGRADVAVVTSDNPRSEDPVGIILQIEDGLRESRGSYVVEVDRRRAITRAIAMAGFEDCVLIAGKGHEDYQIFADRTVHFDDREVAREVLRC